jgi:hypothetical protein
MKIVLNLKFNDDENLQIIIGWPGEILERFEVKDTPSLFIRYDGRGITEIDEYDIDDSTPWYRIHEAIRYNKRNNENDA